MWQKEIACSSFKEKLDKTRKRSNKEDSQILGFNQIFFV
jgi:hypothetical protein